MQGYVFESKVTTWSTLLRALIGISMLMLRKKKMMMLISCDRKFRQI
jgi:hypothetical protein